MALQISIERLLDGNTVEGHRIEFKGGWNPAPIYRSICAFANGIANEGGGYIVVGVEEDNGLPVRPQHLPRRPHHLPDNYAVRSVRHFKTV